MYDYQPYDDPNAAPSPGAPPGASYLTYDFVGFDGLTDVYRGSDGQLYQGDAKGPNGFSPYKGSASDFTPNPVNPGTNRAGAPPPPAPGVPPPPSPAPPPPTTAPPTSNVPTDSSGTPNFYPSMPAFQYPDFSSEFNGPAPPTFQPFSYPDFALPSGQEVLNEDPSYGLRRDEGVRAITNSALAKGVGKGGATLKSLADFAGSLASQEYGSAANRRFGTWQANRASEADIYDRNVRNSLTDYGLKYGAQSDAFQRAEDTYKTNLGKEATRYGFGLDVASGTSQGRAAASNFALNDRNSWFDRLLSLYDLSQRGLPTYSF
jgi:hypothetical protein